MLINYKPIYEDNLMQLSVKKKVQTVSKCFGLIEIRLMTDLKNV